MGALPFRVVRRASCDVGDGDAEVAAPARSPVAGRAATRRHKSDRAMGMSMARAAFMC